MVEEPISIEPQDAVGLRDVCLLLERGSAKLLGPQGEQATLPAPLLLLLQDIVKSLEAGRSLVLLPEEKQLTTQQAGELLGMSRPYVIRLLNDGEMPYHLVGKHRRVALRDVLAFAERRAARKAALKKLSRDAYAAGLYDDAGIPKVVGTSK